MTLISNSFFYNARCTPDKLAIWCEGEKMTYGQLGVFVRKWINAFAAKGVMEGDHIGVLLPNCIEFVALIFVAAELGVVLVPMNTSLPSSAVHRAFQIANVKHVIAKTYILESLFSSNTCDFSFVNGLWVSIDDKFASGVVLHKLLKCFTCDFVPNPTQDDAPLILTMTSGSTGDPKPIILGQNTKFNRAIAAVQLYEITSSDKVLAATPLYHSLAERLVLIPLLIGGTSVLMNRYSPLEWLKCVNEQSVTFTIAVSSQLRQISVQLANAANETKIRSLRCIVASSEQLETQVKTNLLSRIHCQFHECYGTSEIAIASNLNHALDFKKLDSVGKPAPGVEIKILLKNGKIAEAGETGEIICKTPMIFGGYFNRPDLTKEAMYEDYFRTGDIGRMDDEGYLYFMGRIKDVIITGGINIYPKDIESVLLGHPSILECAVFPIHDDKLGEIVAVAIVSRSPESFDKRKIRFYCAKHLADFQQPRRYFLIDVLPKNSVEKVMKRSLSILFAEKKMREI